MSFTKNNYLIIPSVPTPNGGLHLGHIGGPYLSADILARHLRNKGHAALVISGSDSYESYVTKQAAKESLTPEQVANKYHAIIHADLQTMHISLDEFINPLDPKWQNTYKHWHYQILQDLKKNTALIERQEQVYWDVENQHYITGSWLRGQCPICTADIAGYFCEICGAHFRPEQVAQSAKHLSHNVSNLFMRLPAAIDLQANGITKNIQQIFQNFLHQQDHQMRLTANARWGLAYNNETTLFNYGFMFAYFLLFGELAGNLFGTNKNAFAANSKVKVISAFGIDNTIPFIASAVGITKHCQEYKAFDYYLVNHFYHLNGKKFSTSRRHAIWVSDLTNLNIYEVDIIRLYLASMDVRTQVGKYDSKEFSQFYIATVAWIEELIFSAITQLSQTNILAPSPSLLEIFNEIYFQQVQALDAKQFSPHVAVSILKKWLALGYTMQSNGPLYFWWLQALGLLLYPFMPMLGQQLWKALGFAGIPKEIEIGLPPVAEINLQQIRKISDWNKQRWTSCMRGLV